MKGHSPYDPSPSHKGGSSGVMVACFKNNILLSFMSRNTKEGRHVKRRPQESPNFKKDNKVMIMKGKDMVEMEQACM